MGKRISSLSSQPELKANDYLVIDGEDGTRKVAVTDSIAMSGTDAPGSGQGIDGSMYVQYNQSGVVGVFFKTEAGWGTTPKGGSSVKEFQPDVTTGSGSTITVTIE